MEPRISLITLGVADVRRATEFYRALGLPMLDFDSDDAAFFTTEGTWLALYRADLLAEEAQADRTDGNDEAGRNGFGGFTLATTSNLRRP